MDIGHNQEHEWAHCNSCLQQTRHSVIATRQTVTPEEVEERWQINWTTYYKMLECLGCGAATLKRHVLCDELDYDEITYFPPAISRQRPRWYWRLPSEFQGLVEEIYIALQGNCLRLSVMGARTLVDMLMNRSIGDCGGFASKLEKMVDEGHLSKRNKEMLAKALDVGHAVIHRQHLPKKNEVYAVLDIVENLLQPLVLEDDAKKLGTGSA